MKDFKIALCQNKPSRNKRASIDNILKMIKKAAQNGAKLVSLTEIFFHPYELFTVPFLAEEHNETLNLLIKSAKENKVYLCTGSIPEKREDKIFNKSYLISSEGKILLEYAKCHLYDVDFKGLRTKESLFFTPGNKVSSVKTELGNIGIIICYDIRFPEMCRKLTLSGAEIILCPSAFNKISGMAHWHITLRTRAVENQVYIAATAPAFDHESSYPIYGHSLVVDPWGNILAEAEAEEKIISEILICGN